MKIFSNLSEFAKRLLEPAKFAEDEEMWRLDPLSHPALSGMSSRELADLPFNRKQHVPWLSVCK